MKIYLAISILCMLSISCSNTESDKKENLSDTIVGKRNIMDEIAGSSYRSRATEYFLISGTDTSAFSLIVSESKEDSRVNISFENNTALQNNVLYRNRIAESEILLKEIVKDYNVDSLQYFSIGRLASNSDIAIDVSRSYEEMYGKKMMSYDTVRNFMMHSKLTSDINNLFSPYSKKVADISMEKLFFIDKKSFIEHEKFETDTLSVPDRVLDYSAVFDMENVN